MRGRKKSGRSTGPKRKRNNTTSAVVVKQEADQPDDPAALPSQEVVWENKLSTGGDWPLVKFYRFMMCEWFYSNVDQSFFACENDEHEFSAMLKKYYPLLPRHPLNRMEWNHIRRGLRHVTPVRRTSDAFFLRERLNLERHREEVRFLMENQLIECVDQSVMLPRLIDVGCVVRATLFTPQFGSFVGEVMGVEKHECPMYRVRFTNDGFCSEQLLPDYRVAPEECTLSQTFPDVVTVTRKQLKQIAKLEKILDEKTRLLKKLETLRINIETHSMTGQTNVSTMQCYIENVKTLVVFNRSISLLTKHVANDYQQSMCEPFPTEDPVFVAEVTTVGDHLLASYMRLKDPYSNPTSDLLWGAAVHHLRGQPEMLRQLNRYLAHRFRTRFALNRAQ